MHTKFNIFIFVFFLFLSQAIYSQTISNLENQKILFLHNKYRALHHAPKLIWDDELAGYAKQHASKCIFKHSQGPYGENLAMGYTNAEAAINAWYKENEDYSYQHPGFSHQTGHFTQLVWKNTEKLGCANVACEGPAGITRYYLICEYSPAGNIINPGYFERNVLSYARFE